MSRLELRPNSESDPQHLRSYYFPRAEKIASDKFPDQKDALVTMLDEIDRQGEMSLAAFESSRFPGVKVPFNRVEIASVRNTLRHQLQDRCVTGQTEAMEGERRNNDGIVYVVFPAIPIPYFPDLASPYTAWDIVIDRVAKSLMREHVLEVISVGSPLAPGGEISPQWFSLAKKDVLQANGEVFAELIRSIQEKYVESNVRYVFTGLSWGAAMAEATAQALPELQKKLRLLLDNPTSLNHSKLRSLQIIAGFLGEGWIRAQTNRKLDVQSEGSFLLDYKEVLRRKGMTADYTKEEDVLRQQARWAHVIQLIKGACIEIPAVPTYTRRGLFDPTALNFGHIYTALIHELKDKIYQIGLGEQTSEVVISSHEGFRREFATRLTHNIDRHNIRRWLRHIEKINDI